MQPNDIIRLQHIIEEANEALHFVQGYSFSDFKNDSKTVHAVVRAIEVIGEAAAKISPEYKNSHPSEITQRKSIINKNPGEKSRSSIR
jgi:uncharacterized protein with HEPN domain